jgi:trigger factor
LDDELAKMTGGFESLEELQDEIRQDLHARSEAKQLDELAEGLLDSLSEQSKVDAPPVFVNREVEALIRGLAYEIQEQGFTLDGYLKTTNRTAEDLVSEFQPTADTRVKKSLLLTKLVEELGAEVEDSEIEEEVSRMTRVYGQDRQMLRDALLGNAQIREDIRNKLYGRKVVQRLLEKPGEVDSDASGVEPEEPPAEEPSADAGSEEAAAEPAAEE